MRFVEFFLFFIGGYFFGVWWFGVIILPILYGLPRTLYYWIFKKTLIAKSVFFYLGTFAFWITIFIGTAFILVEFLPNVAKYLYYSSGFYYGQLLGVIVSLIRAFSKSGREDLRNDFWAAMAKYKKNSDVIVIRKVLEKLLEMKNEAIDKIAKYMLAYYVIEKEIMLKKGFSEEEVFKGVLEEIKDICKRGNVPDEWSIELTEAFKRKVEEYRSMDEKHSTEMIGLIIKELMSSRGKVFGR